MNRATIVPFLAFGLCLALGAAEETTTAATLEKPGAWPGVDETVVEHFAEAAGRPARDPYINTDQGDLLLFVFLIAGMMGGFVAGYYYRELFPSKKPAREAPTAPVPTGNAP